MSETLRKAPIWYLKVPWRFSAVCEIKKNHLPNEFLLRNYHNHSSFFAVSKRGWNLRSVRPSQLGSNLWYRQSYSIHSSLALQQLDTRDYPPVHLILCNTPFNRLPCSYTNAFLLFSWFYFEQKINNYIYIIPTSVNFSYLWIQVKKHRW